MAAEPSAHAQLSAPKRPLPARWTLARALAWSHALPVLLLTVLLLLGAGALLRKLAYEQAQLQLAQASAAVVRDVDLAHTNLRVSGRLLAERPTLQALARPPTHAEGIREFLDRFRRTGGMQGIRLELPGGDRIDVGRLPPDWAEARLMVATDSNSIWVLRSQAWTEGGRIHLARALKGEDLAANNLLADMSLHLYDQDSARAGDVNAADVIMRRHVLQTLRAESGALPEQAKFVAMEPLLGNQGEVLGLVEVRWPQAVVDLRWRGWIEGFGLLLVVLAALAAAIGLLIANRIGASFAGLFDAARHIGAGDLDTPISIPNTQIRESRALARSMEDMRQGLSQAHLRERQQAQALTSVLDGVEEAILAVDEQRVVRYHNRQSLSLTGLAAGAIDGQFCGDVLRPLPVDGQRRCDVVCPLLLARGHGSAQIAERCQSPRGESTLMVRAAAMVDQRQVLIVREQSAIEAARDMRESILANLTHEFRTPLAGQIASIELLREHLWERGDMSGLELALAQHRTVLRLSQLVDNLLESASLEAGHAPLRIGAVHLDELIEEAALLMDPLLVRRRQKLRLDLGANARELRGDGRRLLQVFLNLIGNANKFAPDDSEIRIVTQCSNNELTVWVEDQGPGLQQAGIGDAFTSLGQSPSDAAERQGNGLGLAIVRSIIERHQGRMQIDPTPGAGRIGFVLPLGG